MSYDIWHMVYGLWFMADNIWRTIYGIWYKAYYLRHMIYGIWYMAYDMWHMIYGIWYMAHDIWHMICGIWYMAYDICHMIYGIWYPNQPHLLNKYQYNMGFSHFHEFGILSGMYILAPCQNIYCESMWFLQWQYYINLILSFFTNLSWFCKMKTTFIWYFILYSFMSGNW